MPQANETQAFKAFLETCREYVVFYGFVCDGMPSFRNWIADLMKTHSVSRSDPYRVGVGNPRQGLYPASLSIGEVLDKSDHDGEFRNLIAKLTIVAIFSMWEDRYRDEIAGELGLSERDGKPRKNHIESELMGDVRHIRICIVHRGSAISDDPPELKALKWTLPPGQLRVTREMMVRLMDQINDMDLRVGHGP